MTRILLEAGSAKHILSQAFYQVQHHEKGKDNILADIENM